MGSKPATQGWLDLHYHPLWQSTYCACASFKWASLFFSSVFQMCQWLACLLATHILSLTSQLICDASCFGYTLFYVACHCFLSFKWMPVQFRLNSNKDIRGQDLVASNIWTILRIEIIFYNYIIIRISLIN